MRIAISGAQNTGKSTLIKDFMTVWPMYQTPGKSYRDILKEQNLPHSTETSRATQLTILKYMTTLQKNFKNTDYVIFDRCPTDCLVYTLWAYEKGLGDIDDAFVSFVIKETKESLRNLDIIFYVPATDNIDIVEDGFRSTDIQYRAEIDTIFQTLFDQYQKQNDVFFPKDDTPGIIHVTGSRQQRLVEIGKYINEHGNIYGEESSLIKPDELDMLTSIIRDQKEQKSLGN